MPVLAASGRWKSQRVYDRDTLWDNITVNRDSIGREDANDVHEHEAVRVGNERYGGKGV